MDFRSLCQKIDIESIRAKMPAMPAMPTLPAALSQLKLPKSIPKLRSRKIFRSSREDISRSSTKRMQAPNPGVQQQQELQVPVIPPAEFINRTPTRISTISSLMQQGGSSLHRHEPQHHENTYCSADSIDDDYPSPSTQHYNNQIRRHSRAISPIRTRASSNTLDSVTQDNVAASSNSVKMSLTERLQKGYKDITEFKLKHIFAKKTIVRKDVIIVDSYVQSFDEDRLRQQQEQERRDKKIAENYRFKYKVSRQNTGHTDSISSKGSHVSEYSNKPDNEIARKARNSVSDDESGMEASPPVRKPGIAATRFARVRNPPLTQMSEDSNFEDANDDGEVFEKCTQKRKENEEIPVMESANAVNKNKGYKERLKRLTSQISTHDESANESATEGTHATNSTDKMFNKFRNLGKATNEEINSPNVEKKRNKAPIAKQESEEEPEVSQKTTTTENANPLTAIKQNFKRFQKSIKKPQASTDESEGEEESGTTKETKSPTKTEKLTARLRRFKSREASIDNISPKKEEGDSTATSKSPIHAAITNKLQNWKKSFKLTAPTESSAQTGDESSPEKQKQQPESLMDKLKYIRARKNPSSGEELDERDDTDKIEKTKEGATRKAASNLETKFEQARQKTIKKVNEKMQQIKFFHKSQEQLDKTNPAHSQNKRSDSCEVDEEELESDDDVNVTENLQSKTKKRGDDMRDAYQSQTEEEAEQIEEIKNIQSEYAAKKTHAVWTTKPPLLSESMDSLESDDIDAEFPRVLIHQDNSDLYESTLIIAVTRPVISPIPIITEILVDGQEKRPTTPTKSKSLSPVAWIPNTEIISTFIEITPPGMLSAETILPPPPMRSRHVRKLSMDSNSDSDSWIPDTTRKHQLQPQNKELERRISIAGLNCIDEHDEPWKVHTMYREEKLYKTKSIDIFEVNAKKGGVRTAFEDFDDELKNEPVLKIASTRSNSSSFDRESSEDADAADDDNSSRITKILANSKGVENEGHKVQKNETTDSVIRQGKLQQIGNSRESLVANFDENEEFDSEDDELNDDDDRPPSTAPSPPPNISPPLPPLPERKPSISIAKQADTVELPPLPSTKPPLPPPLNRPVPKLPERTPSMTGAAKPLVKTASLRLAYSEQVQPADVGKVNKLISRFEQPPTKAAEKRPRIIPRRSIYEYEDDEDEDDEDDDDEDDDDDDDSGDYSEEDENDDDQKQYQEYKKRQTIAQHQKNASSVVEHENTPTPTNTPKTNKQFVIQNSEEVISVIINKPPAPPKRAPNPPTKQPAPQPLDKIPATETATLKRDNENNIELLRKSEHQQSFNQSSNTDLPATFSTNLECNSNCSRPASEYGSPLAYPSSLKGSTETTPVPERKQQDELRVATAARSRRSMTRDDEHFLSFDSDEENSYYSISSSGSNRYVVEI